MKKFNWLAPALVFAAVFAGRETAAGYAIPQTAACETLANGNRTGRKEALIYSEAARGLTRILSDYQRIQKKSAFIRVLRAQFGYNRRFPDFQLLVKPQKIAESGWLSHSRLHREHLFPEEADERPDRRGVPGAFGRRGAAGQPPCPADIATRSARV